MNYFLKAILLSYLISSSSFAGGQKNVEINPLEGDWVLNNFRCLDESKIGQNVIDFHKQALKNDVTRTISISDDAIESILETKCNHKVVSYTSDYRFRNYSLGRFEFKAIELKFKEILKNEDHDSGGCKESLSPKTESILVLNNEETEVLEVIDPNNPANICTSSPTILMFEKDNSWF